MHPSLVAAASFASRCVVRRFAVVMACRSGSKSARLDGLGKPFIGSVGFLWLILSAVINFAIVGILDVDTRLWLILGAIVLATAFGGVLQNWAPRE